MVRKSEARWLPGHAAELGICLFLVAATLAVYGRTAGYEFTTCDDDDYVYQNRHVVNGLTLEGIGWAFTHVHSANWHPLTTLSHMLDCTLYGLWAGGHHLTNVVLHAASSVVLFLALRRMTGAVWPSGMVAALFCLHPLHVESVAWVSERKDVLSGLFFGLTLWAYAGYAQRPFSWARYALVVFFFALGLLCKPMLVTLPFVLLLLDYWPGRSGARGAGSSEWGAGGTRYSVPSSQYPVPRPSSFIPHPSSFILRPSALIFLEKLPLIALSAASCVVTYLVQSSAGAVTEREPWNMRLQTTLTAYVGYLIKMLWPFDLAVRYPRVRTPFVPADVACGLALAAVTLAVIFLARRGLRYLAVGWFWYLGMLAPVIGLVTIGDQAMADRYTYLPLIGIFIALVWGGADLIQARSASEATPTLSVSEAANLPSPSGRGAGGEGIGLVWAVAGVVLALCAARSFDQVQYWRDSKTLLGHAVAVVQEEHASDVAAGLQRELAVNPRDLEARKRLAFVWLAAGRLQDGIGEFREMLRQDPNEEVALNSLAWLLATNPEATIRNGPEAVEFAQRAVRQHQEDQPELLDTLAAAYAEAGRFPEAVQTAEKALAAASRWDNKTLSDGIQQRLKLYRAGKPYREAKSVGLF